MEITEATVFKIRNENDYDVVCFDPSELFKLLGCSGVPLDSGITADELTTKYVKKKHNELLAKKANEYIKDHPEILDSPKRPKNYMIANSYKFMEETMLFLPKVNITTCEDLELLLIIFGKTVNGTYIPKRKIQFFPFSFNKVYYFTKKELEEV